MPESLELILRVQTQGQEHLNALQRAIQGISGQARQGSGAAKEYVGTLERTAASTRPVKEALDEAARATAKSSEAFAGANRAVTGLGGSFSALQSQLAGGGITKSIATMGQQADKLHASLSGSAATATRWQGITGLGGQQLARFDGALRATADGAGQATRGFDAASASLSEMIGGFGLAVIRSAGATAAFGATGKAAFDLVAHYGAAAQQTERLAASLGIGVAEAERWQAMTRLAGTGTNALEAAAGRVAAAIEDTGRGGAKVIAVLHELGVNFRTARGETREYGAVARDAITALAGMEDAAKRYALAQRLLGSEGAKQLLPVLAHFREWNAQLDQMGIGLDDQVTKNLAKAGGEIDKARLAWDKFKQSLAEAIAPIVIPVVQMSTALVAGKASPPAALTGPAMGGPIATDSYRSVEGQLLDDSRALLGLFGPGLGPGAGELGRIFGAVQQAILDRNKPVLPKTTGGRTPADTRAAQFQSLLDSLDVQGLSPLAKLLADTQNRLRALAAKYGPMTGAEQGAAAQALRGALARQTGRNAPESSMVDLATTGFQYGGLRTLPVSAEVDARITESTVADFQQRRLQALRQYTSFQEQITRLTAGPGGELAAIERIALLREDAAQREFAITRDRARLDEQTDQARKERVLSILELQRKQLEDYKNTAGEVYDALTQRGGGGLRDFFRGQANILQRQLFVNASAGIFRQFGGALGRVGAASGLGGLLSGTIFDPANAGNTTAANTTATERNTLALERNTAVTAGGGIAGQIPGLAGGAGGGLLSRGIPGLGGSTAQAGGGKLAGIFAGLSSPLTAGLFRGFQGGDYSIATGDGTATSASALGLTSTGARLANIGASAAIVAGGTAGILSGLRQGGARGATTAIASGLGVASTIPGPQQPFLQAAALVAGLVTGLFPDAKKQREEDIARTLQRGAYTDAVGADRFTDEYGRDLDYNRRGELRVMQPVTVNVSAMDSKSFLDRAEDIGNAVKAALQGGHDVADSMRGLVFVR